MTKYLVANWKMNVPEEGLEAYLHALGGWPANEDVEVVVAPPFTILAAVSAIAQRESRRLGVSAQNCSDKPKGAFTGEVAASMIATAGARFAIVGHSERRHIFGESDETTGAKLNAALGAGLIPILCIGEEEAVRERGETRQLLEKQIEGALKGLAPAEGSFVVAYEPVWAIGTGRNATPEIVAETHAEIGAILGAVAGWRPAILYGGSVSPDNAAELAAVGNVDGFLVGGASLVSSKFKVIYDALVGDDVGHVGSSR